MLVWQTPKPEPPPLRGGAENPCSSGKTALSRCMSSSGFDIHANHGVFAVFSQVPASSLEVLDLGDERGGRAGQIREHFCRVFPKIRTASISLCPRQVGSSGAVDRLATMADHSPLMEATTNSNRGKK